jgi:hypothetical protein
MDNDASSCYSVVVGGFEPSSPTLSSSSGSNHVPGDDAVEYCQCIDSEDVALLECKIVAHFLSLALTAPCY